MMSEEFSGQLRAFSRCIKQKHAAFHAISYPQTGGQAELNTCTVVRSFVFASTTQG